MDNQKHTPEPWRSGTTYHCIHQDLGNHRYAQAIAFVEHRDGLDLCLANRDRIIACVNACAGMPDPKEWIDALEKQRDQYKTERNELLNMKGRHLTIDVNVKDGEEVRALFDRQTKATSELFSFVEEVAYHSTDSKMSLEAMELLDKINRSKP